MIPFCQHLREVGSDRHIRDVERFMEDQSRADYTLLRRSREPVSFDGGAAERQAGKTQETIYLFAFPYAETNNGLDSVRA